MSDFSGPQPLTTPPASSPGINPSLVQIITKGLRNPLRLSITNVPPHTVDEIRVVQAEFLSELEMNRDKVRAALSELSSRRKSLVGSVTDSV